MVMDCAMSHSPSCYQPDAGCKSIFHDAQSRTAGNRLARVEKILRKIGFALASVPEAHLCCGSAGSYSILQNELSQQLPLRKLESLGSGSPAAIVTANIGCLMHLNARSTVPTQHWVELLVR
ncbi:MAG: heterodisulfide reductase-related iron-sulfur binding cluster [Pseudomonadota bacterium]